MTQQLRNPAKIDWLEIPAPDLGSTLTVPSCQYLLNEKQQFMVMGVNFDEYPKGMDDIIGENEGMKYTGAGKINDLPFTWQAQAKNSLELDGWDWEAYPNPEIILIENIKS